MNVFVFCLLLLIVIVLLVHLFSWWQEQVRYPKDTVVWDIYPDELKVGDMLMTTTSKKTWRFGWWKHIAVVFKNEQGKMCVADFSKNGLVIEACETHIRHGAKSIIYGIRRRGVDATEEQTKALREAIFHHHNTSFQRLWIMRWLFKRIFNCSFDAKAENCVSFVIDCLQKADLLPAYVNINRHVATLYECARRKDLPYNKEVLVKFKKA